MLVNFLYKTINELVEGRGANAPPTHPPALSQKGNDLCLFEDRLYVYLKIGYNFAAHTVL
jgi:hypothetical protein